MMDPSRAFIAVMAFVAVAHVGHAQDKICACSPGSYTFTLDFSSNCTDLIPTGGIAASTCESTLLGSVDSVVDYEPVSKVAPSNRQGCEDDCI